MFRATAGSSAPSRRHGRRSGVGPIPEGSSPSATHWSRRSRRGPGSYDTDTVACITSSLMGGAPSAVPPEWRRVLFGWPGYEVEELTNLVERVIAPQVAEEPCP